MPNTPKLEVCGANQNQILNQQSIKILVEKQYQIFKVLKISKRNYKRFKSLLWD